ncbi:hypothetical protein AAVH_09776 [Aphelenchoides avenae]|nr:hypothetical protein AAVH_09776 [Aphelenchus avenae]
MAHPPNLADLPSTAHAPRLSEVLPPGVESWVAYIIQLQKQAAAPRLPDGWIRLCCFGQDLLVDRDTLRRGQPSLFDQLDWEPKDSRGAILLNRDYDLVYTMITYLRYGRLMLRGRHTVEDVLVEARHWCLSDLRRYCELEIANASSVGPTATGDVTSATATQASVQSQNFYSSPPLAGLLAGTTPPPLDPSLSGRYTPPHVHMNIQSRRFHDAVKNRLCDDELLAAQQTDAAASGSAVASGNGARDGGTLDAAQQYQLAKLDFRGGRPIKDAIRAKDGRWDNNPYINGVPRVTAITTAGRMVFQDRVPPPNVDLGEVHDQIQKKLAEEGGRAN